MLEEKDKKGGYIVKRILFSITFLFFITLFSQSAYAADSKETINKASDSKLFTDLVVKAESVALVPMEEEYSDTSFDKQLPAISDKVIIWDTKKKCLSNLFYRLPSDMRASSTDTDVSVIMIQDSYKEQTGSYINGAPAYEYRMKIAIVNCMTEQGVLLNMVGGAAPFSIMSTDKAGYGTKIDFAEFIIGVYDRQRALNISPEKITKAKSDKTLSIIGAKDNWIYYTGMENGIYKMKNDGTALKKLTSEPAWMKAELLGDWIVFNDFIDDVYVVKTDGAVCKNLLKSYCYQVYSGFIYYVDSNDSHIYRIKPDGTGKKKLTREAVDYLAVNNGFIYYSNNSKNQFYRIKTNGTGKKKLSNNCAEDIVFLGNRIYFKDENNNFTPYYYSMYMNGTGKKQMKNNIGNVIYSDGIYYYINYEDGLLYQTNDANCKICSKVNNVSPEWFAADGDFLYFIDNEVLYRMKRDGTSRAMICEAEECKLADGMIYIKKNECVYKISLNSL